jgi:hypothetical protein
MTLRSRIGEPHDTRPAIAGSAGYAKEAPLPGHHGTWWPGSGKTRFSSVSPCQFRILSSSRQTQAVSVRPQPPQMAPFTHKTGE